jgi:hypothetical protein
MSHQRRTAGDGKLYRECVVEWRELDQQSLSSSVRQDLKRLLDAYSRRMKPCKISYRSTVEDGFFVNFAFHLDLLPIEKQSLLEAYLFPARSLTARYARF